MSDQPLLLAFALILVVLFVQSLIMLVGAWKIRRGFSELDRNLDSMATKLSQGLERLHGMAGRLAQGTSRLPEWESRLREASVKVMEAIRSGDQAVALLIERMQEHTQQVSQKLDQGIQSFSHYSFQVHQSIVHPSRRISEALQTFTAYVRSVFARDRSSLPPEFVAEEEEFI